MKTCLFAALLALACQHHQSQQSAVTPVQDTLRKSSQVKGCADPSRSLSKSNPEALSAEDPGLPIPGNGSLLAAGDSVRYERYVRHGCCRQARISSEVSQGVVTFTEYWWGQICKCLCESTLQARVGGLPPGTYRVYVVETGTDPVTDQPVAARDTVLFKTVEIR